MAGSVITAGTTRTQAGATQITADITTVNTSTAATAGTNFGDGVALPLVGSGTDRVFLINNTANPIQVYAAVPVSGTADTINGIAGATGIAMPPNSSATFIEANAGAWQCLLDATQQAAFNTVASATTMNLTAAQISGGEAAVDLAITGVQAGAITANLPTAANLLQSLYGVAVGQTYRLRITNTNTTQTITVATATGWTLTGTMTIATATWREFIVTVTSASAVTLQNVAVGTFS
ncbi:hypothetical protein KDX40_04875 [Burkholderia ambifaria]|uniref:hypothetical protein n=1 Tax=Burkholderia ambifaria TaxID=152480 RepID=UPI001BA2EB6A|nr:hypothetical protein [Burkholderia ambifaria]MBR8343071.1 hypothetical protein [Burkholderia ambifaria]